GPCGVCRLYPSRGRISSRTKRSVRSFNSISSSGIAKSISQLSLRHGFRAPAALAQRDVEPRGDDDRRPDPGPQIGEIVEDQVAEGRRADELDIAERRDDR